MLWNASALKGFNIQGSDGLIGTIGDLLFDDKSWQTKWLVVHTGLWLFGRKILLPLAALGTPDEDARLVTVRLTQQQIKDSPDVDTDLPVSRHVEAHVYNYYDQNPYWRSGFSPMGVVPQDTLVFMPRIEMDEDPRYHPGTDALPEDGDPHLRSANAVTGYHVEASDGAIGHVEDFLIDDSDWRVIYLTVDTKNWLPGQRVVVSPQSIREIDELTQSVFLNVDREKIKASPPYDPEMAGDGPFNDRFHKYFGLTLLDGDELRKLKITS